MFVTVQPGQSSPALYYGTDHARGRRYCSAPRCAGVARRSGDQSQARVARIARRGRPRIVGVRLPGGRMVDPREGNRRRLVPGRVPGLRPRGRLRCSPRRRTPSPARWHEGCAFGHSAPLGLISYGVYLWHWPIDVVLNAQRTHLGGWWLFALQTATTLSIAALSYRLLEQPIRRGALSARQWRAVTPTVAIGLVLVLVVSTQGARTHVAAVSASDAIAKAVREAHAAPAGTKRLLIVGNSVAFFLGEAFKEIRAEPPIVTLNTGIVACFFPPNNGVRPNGGDPEGPASRLSARARRRGRDG